MVSSCVAAVAALAPVVASAWTWPVEGPVLRPFSLGPNPYAGGQHRVIDIGAASGGPVAAPAGGTVSFAGTVPTSGKSVTIQTADGLNVTLTHLGSISVARGAAVVEGQQVGTVGPSGTVDLAVPYLSLGIRVTSNANGYLDPLGLLPAAPVVAPAPLVVTAPAVALEPVPAQPVVAPEPAASPQPVLTTEPVVVAQPVVGAPPVVVPAPVAEPQPAAAPVTAPQPVVAPEPVGAPQPVVAPQPIVAPQPVVTPQPIVAPQPVEAPQPVTAAAPVEPAAVKEGPSAGVQTAPSMQVSSAPAGPETRQPGDLDEPPDVPAQPAGRVTDTAHRAVSASSPGPVPDPAPTGKQPAGQAPGSSPPVAAVSSLTQRPLQAALTVSLRSWAAPTPREAIAARTAVATPQQTGGQPSSVAVPAAAVATVAAAAVAAPRVAARGGVAPAGVTRTAAVGEAIRLAVPAAAAGSRHTPLPVIVGLTVLGLAGLRLGGLLVRRPFAAAGVVAGRPAPAPQPPVRYQRAARPRAYAGPERRPSRHATAGRSGRHLTRR